jgi:putative oxidoreductase
VIARAAAIAGALERAAWIPALLVRLFVGYFFFVTGRAKVQDLGAMAERFAGWGIPAPALSAALSGYTELIGGALVVLGLFTRLACVPLAVNMVVAIATVNIRRVSELDEFFELAEPLYALAFLWLLFAGPGRISLDALLRRWLAPASGATSQRPAQPSTTTSASAPR